MQLQLFNTLTRKKELFTPQDAGNVRMYVCGPTVYDRAHIGNARSVVVYDVLFRLLKQIYGPEAVTYARNITDIDDRINNIAKARGITIRALADEVTGWFHSDMQVLGVLPSNPNKSSGLMVEPKATDYIKEMVIIIERLINNSHAYAAQGHVLFDVTSCPSSPEKDAMGYYYGILSGRVQDDLEAGARVKVESYKKNPGDFVLWKPADAEDDPSSLFDSPWGKGRPGWHIECSAMSHTHLGDNFDIHGGGADLMFPHHENEIAQSRCAFPGSTHAKYWVHNGFLTVNGEKMSKSLGNFITVRDLLDKGVKGEVIRYALLKTKYREPLDWSDKLMDDAKKDLDGFYRKLGNTAHEPYTLTGDCPLLDDLNLPAYFAELHKSSPAQLKSMGALVGILQQNPESWFKGESQGDDAAIQAQIDARVAAKKAKNWKEADRIRDELKGQGILLEDRPDGSSDWRRG